MYNENEISLIGTVGKDPEVTLKQSNGQNFTIAKFSMATNKKFKKSDGSTVEKTTWHNISFIGKLAEKVIGPYVKKGSYIKVKGEQDHRSYENSNGEIKYYSEVIGGQIGLLSSGNSQTHQNQNQTAPGPQNDVPPPTQQDLDDLPF